MPPTPPTEPGPDQAAWDSVPPARPAQLSGDTIVEGDPGALGW
ncbi:MAG: hypothetical protein ACRDZ8_01785 [Acidimicrobiales bacterium]